MLLSYREVMERSFGQWSMGYASEMGFTNGINLKYSGGPAEAVKPVEITDGQGK
jgi:hypothetical protein